MSCAKALWRDEEYVFEELGKGLRSSPETWEKQHGKQLER